MMVQFYIEYQCLDTIAQRPVAQLNSSDNQTKLIAFTSYELTRMLPNNLKSSLPSIEKIENELNKSPEVKK